MSSIDTSFENEIKSLNNTILNMISNRFKLLWVNLPLLCFPFQLRSSVTNVQFIQCFYSCMIFELDKQVDDLRRNIWMEAEDVAPSPCRELKPRSHLVTWSTVSWEGAVRPPWLLRAINSPSSSCPGSRSN